MPTSDKFQTKWRYEPYHSKKEKKYEGYYYNWIKENELG